METQSNLWLPLTEYALRSGMSISTLRRKIKSNTISYKMEEGRYLIRGDELAEGIRPTGFSSSDEPASRTLPSARPMGAEKEMKASAALASSDTPTSISSFVPGSPVTISGLSQKSTSGFVSNAATTETEVELLRDEIRRLQEDNVLRWKALEARVSGIAKKLEFFSEQMAEAKMLVKIFEEKLDGRA